MFGRECVEDERVGAQWGGAGVDLQLMRVLALPRARAGDRCQLSPQVCVRLCVCT